MQQRDSAMHLERGQQSWLFQFSFIRWRSDSDIPCALRDSREPQEHTQKKRRDEDEADLKISAAPAGVLCALAFFSTATPAAAAPVDYCRTGHFRNARLRLFQPGAMPGDGFCRGSNCYENPFPRAQRQRQRERQRQSERQRLCLSAEAPCFERRKEAG